MKRLTLALVFGMIGPFIMQAQEPDAGKLDAANDVWKPLRPLVGKWAGERTGMGGDARQTVEWKFVLGDQFLQCKTVSIATGDPHEDIGMISYDQSRKKFVYRCFFSEGFVNQYVGTISNDGKTIEFEAESIENGPPGMRVKEVMKIDGNSLGQELLLASGDKPYKSCIISTLTRKE